MSPSRRHSGAAAIAAACALQLAACPTFPDRDAQCDPPGCLITGIDARGNIDAVAESSRIADANADAMRVDAATSDADAMSAADTHMAVDAVGDIIGPMADASDIVEIVDVFEACVPMCTGRQCGSNGCGGPCGICGPLATCSPAGTCVIPLYHGWTSPVPGCVTTTYDTTAPTNLGGTYPFIAGDSNGCRAWKLAATVCTTEPAAYSDTVDFTCPLSGGFTDPTFGTYCSVPNQYACSACPGACNAGCRFTPLSLRDCSGTEAAQQ